MTPLNRRGLLKTLVALSFGFGASVNAKAAPGLLSGRKLSLRDLNGRLGKLRVVTNLGNIGTSLGDLTAGGGLAAAFDGTTSQAAASCARKINSTRSYIGKNYSGGSPSAYAINRVTYYTSSDQGLSSNGAVSCTVQLRGMHTAPSSANDAGSTLLGTDTFTDSNSTQTRTINSSDTTTEWEYVWIDIQPGGGGPNDNIAELQIFGYV